MVRGQSVGGIGGASLAERVKVNLAYIEGGPSPAEEMRHAKAGSVCMIRTQGICVARAHEWEGPDSGSPVCDKGSGFMPSELGRHWGFGAEEYREPSQKDPSCWCLKRNCRGARVGAGRSVSSHSW